MKGFILIVAFLWSFVTAAQSPYLSILVKMDSASNGSAQYQIEMKFCEPRLATAKGTWLTSDTSAINFSLLKIDDINCGEYFENGMPQLISGKEEAPPPNQFRFGNQVFAWEKIFIIRIKDKSTNAAMYIVMPMQYKAFATYVSLRDIVFSPGKLVFPSGYSFSRIGTSLAVNLSLRNYPAMEIANLSFKEALEMK